MGGGVELEVGGKNTEMVKVVGGTLVVSVRVLELAKVVQSGDLFESELSG